MLIMKSKEESPVGFTSSANLADCVAVPAKHWRNSTDEGESPDEQNTQCCMFDS